MIRIPRPSYILSQLTPHHRPDSALYQVLARLAELYQLGEIRTCHRAQRSNSLNFVVNTARGKFIFRQHRLSEDAVAYEHQVLDHLQQRDFPAPRLLLNQAGQAWSAFDGSLYSVYGFVEGYSPTCFLWSPAAWRGILTQYGRTLGKYHQAVADLVPSAYKWNGYRPAEHRRWREGDWFRQALAQIRPLLQKLAATNPIDDWTRSHLDALDTMLRLESIVEERADLSKLVIHGDYSPWNVLFRRGQSPCVLDFNESRLDLKIYDIMLATFWFAWRDGHLDQDVVLPFQTGYNKTGQLHKADINLAGTVFQWIMARSLTERLHTHYLGQRPLRQGAAGMEKQYQMCVFAGRQPQQLVAGLKGSVAG
ncbi:MAG: phosphotransferase [Chloroflexota bacterium]|nr:phosphotransferase [Chloroflexota bacterium]